jgi:hypothetical protein
MPTKIKIALQIPDTDKPDRYFPVRLQENLRKVPWAYAATSQLFAISNIKGNFQVFCQLLTTYKVIDQYFNWTFGDGHLVVLGAGFDGSSKAIECLWLLYSLEEKARLEGGCVHFILGSEEIIRIHGDWRFIHPPYSPVASHPDKYRTALYDANHELSRWICTKNTIEKIGKLLFVQANILTTIHTQNEAITEEDLTTLLADFNTDIMVTSDIAEAKISPAFNGRLINIAMDHSKENSQGLLIRQTACYRADQQGRKEKLRLALANH